MKSLRPESRDHTDDLLGILRIGRLRDLQMELLRAQAVFREKALQQPQKATVEKVDARDVHRDGKAEVQTLLPVAHLCGHFPPHILIQLLDETVELEQRDEFPRVY